MQEKHIPTIMNTWTQAFETMMACKSSLGRILFAAVVVPSTIKYFISGSHSQSIVEQIKSIDIENYMSILNPSAGYFLNFIGMNMAVFFFLSCAFVAAIIVVSGHTREDPVSPKQALIRSVRLTFPHGLIITIFASMMSLERVFLGPFKIFTLFSLMAAVIVVQEKKSCFSALKRALLFRYSSPINGGSLSAAFVLIGLGALVFAWEYSIDLISNALLFGDEFLHIPRGLWSSKLPGVPFSAVQIISSLIQSIGLALLVAMVACYLVSLYNKVRPRIANPA